MVAVMIVTRSDDAAHISNAVSLREKGESAVSGQRLANQRNGEGVKVFAAMRWQHVIADGAMRIPRRRRNVRSLRSPTWGSAPCGST
jgi:hypothetical protein